MTDNEINQEIALTIILQLGGLSKLQLMVSAHHIYYQTKGVQFKFKGSSFANWISIKLNSSDLYNVSFCKINRTTITNKKEIKDIGAEQLIELFENYTGLYLTL